MPALNFQKQFAPLVALGLKQQTIRAYRKDGRDPKPGQTLYLFTGMRTKACHRIAEVECRQAIPFGIEADGTPTLGHLRLLQTRDEFAMEDGFESYSEMLAWFEKTHGLPFRGLLICWKMTQ